MHNLTGITLFRNTLTHNKADATLTKLNISSYNIANPILYFVIIFALFF